MRTGLVLSSALGVFLVLNCAVPAVAQSTRYGLFNGLDSNSSYGKGVYPEPFLVDDSDLEDNEARLDWLHTEGHGTNTDLVTAEVEKGFGELTLELEVPFERDETLETDPVTGQSMHDIEEGLANVSLGARYPFYQWVSQDQSIDTTFGAAIEVGIPSNSIVSKNTEIVPKIFDDLKVGDHFTLQSIIGYSMLLGGGDDGNLNTFEYGFVFGWTIPHRELPIPDVAQLIPILELSGETELNKDDPGHNSLVSNAGFRVNLNAIGTVQPRLGLGYVFPIDEGGREDLHWGMITSLVFEY